MSVETRTDPEGSYRHVLRVGAHTVHADMAPPDGEGSAPGPHDYFDASLAACKSLTAMWYAKRHKLALDRIEVKVDRDDSHEREGKYRLMVHIQLFGALSDEDKKKIHAAVARCPIHKLMTTTEIEIETAPLTQDVTP